MLVAAFFETVRVLPGGVVFIPRYMEWLDFGFYTFCFLVAFIYPFFSDAFEDD